MSLDYEKRLEAEADRALKSLPEFIAPQTLVLRVTTAIQQAQAVPWYRQPWQMWPSGLQAVSFILLLALFGTLCFGSWKLTHAESFAAALQRPLGWVSTFSALGHALNVVVDSLMMAIKNLHTGILITCVAALGLGYAMCVWLGTVYLRLALARR